MNILLLRQYNPYAENGASANRFRGLVDGLCRQGHCVTIAVVGGVIQKNENIIIKSSNKKLNFEYLSQSNHYGYMQRRLNGYLFDDTINLWIARRRLRRLLKQHYDVLWLTNNVTVLSLFLNCSKTIVGKTFIELNEFNDIYKEETGGNFLQRKKGAKSNQIFLETIESIDLFGVMTKTLITYYKTMAKPEAKFMHLPMTVDLSRFADVATTNDYKKPYIAFTGTMTNQKDGVDVLIKAFAKVANKHPAYQLYLAGFWHYDVPTQMQLISEFGLQERIHYLGVLNRDQIPPFLCNAAVLALSRPDSHQAQGGFPTKLGEYLATGNPVCVTSVGEIPDYLKDNLSAFMARPGDVDSFADALDRALCDETNAKKVGVNGRKVAEECFNDEIQAKKLSEFLKENL